MCCASVVRADTCNAQLQSLRILGLDYNVLRTTHPHLERLTRLERLHLSHNKLSSLPSLEGLERLRFLSLENNMLKMPLEPLAFRSLRSLTSLGLAGNRLGALPATFAGDLSTLSLPRKMLEGRKGPRTGGDEDGAAALDALAEAMDAVVAGEDIAGTDDVRLDTLFDPRLARVRPGARVAGRVVTLHQVVTEMSVTAEEDEWEPIDALRRMRQLAQQMTRELRALAAGDMDAADAPVGGRAASRGKAAEGGGGPASARAGSARGPGGASKGVGPSKGKNKPKKKNKGGDDDDDAEDVTALQLQALRTLSLNHSKLQHLPDCFGCVRCGHCEAPPAPRPRRCRGRFLSA